MMTISKRKTSVVFKFTSFSKKQKQVLSWWKHPKYKEKLLFVMGLFVLVKQLLCRYLTSFGQWKAMMKINSEWLVKQLVH